MKRRETAGVGKVPGLDSHLGYWLRVVSNDVSHGFALKLEGKGVTVAEWVVMRELYDAPSAGWGPSALAEGLGLTKGAISKLADRLLGKGLVWRKSKEGDGRAQLLGLTGKGREMVPVLAGLADENDAEFFGGLEAGERAGLEKLLRGLAEARGMKGRAME